MSIKNLQFPNGTTLHASSVVVDNLVAGNNAITINGPKLLKLGSLTTVQRTGLAAVADGTICYDTDLNELFLYDGAWTAIGAGGSVDTITSNGGTLTVTTAGSNVNLDVANVATETDVVVFTSTMWAATANADVTYVQNGKVITLYFAEALKASNTASGSITGTLPNTFPIFAGPTQVSTISILDCPVATTVITTIGQISIVNDRTFTISALGGLPLNASTSTGLDIGVNTSCAMYYIS